MRAGIACGGTGGHVFPGLAIGRELLRRGHSVVIWLGGRDVENASVEGWAGPVERVPSVGFPVGFSPRTLAAGARAVRAVLECRRRMAGQRPDVLLAMGSYASVGPVLAARWLGVPVVIHEANAVPGRAVSLLSRVAAAAAVTFEQTASRLHAPVTVCTGMPLRDGVCEGVAEGLFDAPGFTVLVMGGSLGAAPLNQVVPAALCRLHGRREGLQVIHLSGKADESAVEALYAEGGVRHRVFGFLSEMGRAYASADLAICRAGASTCMELAAAHVPCVLVPLPSAVRDHQTANARALVEVGGAELMLQRELSVDGVARCVEAYMDDRARLDRMGTALESMAASGATPRVADLVERVGGGSGGRSLDVG